ncbi:hypothetical protein [Anaerorhabdus sp.]|uniref:hypothetical protein n=1 Tax=Anaerorhabdus sp. TaxID=1872524 RepID=UPI002FC99B50
MNSNKGFILVDMSLCILISIVIVMCIFGVKFLEIKNQESMNIYAQENDQYYLQIIANRSECEIECVPEIEEVPPLNAY